VGFCPSILQTELSYLGNLQIDRDSNSPELSNVGDDYNAALEYSSTSTTMPAIFLKCKLSCDLKTLE
jgi:hypothetical protein